MKYLARTQHYTIEAGDGATVLWRYRSRTGGKPLDVAPPRFEVAGRPVCRAEALRVVGRPSIVSAGVHELTATSAVVGHAGLFLDLVIRIADQSPVLRFCYRLRSETATFLTKSQGQDVADYLTVSLADYSAVREICLSEFDDATHSFRLTEKELPVRAFDNGVGIVGPILVGENGKQAMLLAYEHGAQIPDAFLMYRPDSTRRVVLSGTKGNYWDRQVLDSGHPLVSPWFHLALNEGSINVMASLYRTFVLRYMSPNVASRKSYVFYNTWCFQERNKWWNKKTYLASMNAKRMEAEIDVAAKMGIDVFVLDTGWYEKTGDWKESRKRFPNGLKSLSSRLKKKKMKLGLWFSPTHAAVTSQLSAQHQDCIMSWDGRVFGPHPIWETEDSHSFCLVSRYWEAFADELIRLTREFGVTYFKWDAVGQYGCNSPDHDHGTAANTPDERSQSYAYLQVRYMQKVIDKLCKACPEAIVDFDITEGGRTVGLAFLASGKYFLINNGPYFPNLDHPWDWATAEIWSNVYVYPGMARPRLCRVPLEFDKWIPSILFLTHYLPDDPADSQEVNLASLVLGQNGIWGDLLTVSKEGVALFKRTLALYKQVRDDITAASPVRTGITGGSPEVHEKLDPATGRGVVCLFANAPGQYTYITSIKTATSVAAMTKDVIVKRLKNGTARLDCTFERPGARVVFFGVSR